ncbi:Actin [Durusdinium trenchii]|uniref:Actin n=1 Tax=Durusdinium trenchii TaxID=1381693 RepID=A0ABP0L2H0_9DINO
MSSFELLDAPLSKTAPLTVVPFLAHPDSCALFATSRGCQQALAQDALWIEMVVEHFNIALNIYDASLVAPVPNNPEATQNLFVKSVDRPMLLDLVKGLPKGIARQVYLRMANATSKPFRLRPRARLSLEIHELSDWNRLQQRLIALRQAECVAGAFASNASAGRLREAARGVALELLVLEALVAGEGKVAQPKLPQDMAWDADTEASYVQDFCAASLSHYNAPRPPQIITKGRHKILERRSSQRRMWFRKQREFLLQDLYPGQ